MPNSITDTHQLLLDAIAFAARGHQGQVRKDGQTPYVSHVFRVCMILRDLFGVGDHRILAAAVLHDTLEDTTFDFDDLEGQFGKEIATWVAMLSKDKRMIYEEREEAYQQVLADAPWQVQVCKLADIVDNVLDGGSLTPAKKAKGLKNKRDYLRAMQSNLKPEAEAAWKIADELMNEITSHESAKI